MERGPPGLLGRYLGSVVTGATGPGSRHGLAAQPGWDTIAAALQWLPARVMFVVFPDGIPSGRRPLRQNSRYLYGQTRALPTSYGSTPLFSLLFHKRREKRYILLSSLPFLFSSLSLFLL